MSDMAGGADDRGRSPVEDAEIEALLTGGGTDRQELASVGRLLDELRAPCPVLDPRPSGDLARLFAEGPGGVLGPAPTEVGDWILSPLAPGRAASTGRKPVRRLAKVAAVTTTAALAVTLAAAAQVLPGSQPKTSVSVSGPAAPVRVGADQSVTVRPPDLAIAPGVTVRQPMTSTSLRSGATVRSTAEADLNALSPEALARLPIEVLKSLSPENLGRLPVEVLRTLPGDVLARLSVDVLRTLPADTLVRLPADAVRTLPGDVLARLPLDLLRALPTDVQSRLPADIQRLVLVRPTPTVTASAPGSVRP